MFLSDQEPILLAKCDKNAWVVIQKQLGYEVTLNGVNERGIKEKGKLAETPRINQTCLQWTRTTLKWETPLSGPGDWGCQWHSTARHPQL